MMFPENAVVLLICLGVVCGIALILGAIEAVTAWLRRPHDLADPLEWPHGR